MTYFNKPVGQDMKKKSSDKFMATQGHYFSLSTIGIITPEKGDLALFKFDDTVIADSNSVSISAEVVKDPFYAVKGRFAIDNPFLMVELSAKSFKFIQLFYMTDTRGKSQFS